MKVASCSTCRFAMPEDGGDGTCYRGELGYSTVRSLRIIECPRYKKRAAKRPEPPKQEGLF